MKYLLIVLSLFSSAQSKAQINPFLGIHQLDQCDFSTPCSYLEIPDTANNIWVIGHSQKNHLQHVGKVLITDTLLEYPINTNQAAEIHWPAWDMYPLSFILSFHHSMDADSLMDGGIVEVSRDHGNTWTNVIDDPSNLFIYTTDLYTQTDTLFTGEKGFSGTYADRYTEIEWVWAFPLKDLPTDTMYYRFRFISDSINQHKEGWMISDLTFSYADMGTGLHDFENFDFTISPNPSNGTITIHTSEIVQEMMVYDIFGSMQLMTVNENKKALDLSGLSKGVYFLQIMNDKHQISRMQRLLID